jgi:hypothetical protein
MEQADQENSINSLISSAISIDVEKLALYLWVIEAPPTLEGLLQVTAQFKKIIRDIKAICHLEGVTDFVSEEQIEDCKLVADAITNCKIKIENILPASNIKQSDKKPFRGLLTKRHLYTCLGISCLQGNNAYQHLLLEAYLVVASGILRHRRERHCDPKEYRVALDESCRLARQLLLNPKSDSHNNLPQQLPTIRGDYLQDIDRSGELLKCIHTLLDYALSGKRAPTYIKSGSPRKSHLARHSINDAVDPALLGKVDTIEMLQPIADLACRLDAPESTGGVEFYQAVPPQGDVTSSSQYTRKKRHYLSSIAMHNQRFSFRWEILSLYEISCFMEVVRQLSEGTFQHKVGRRFRRIDQRELAAAAATIFLRCISLEKLSSLKLNDSAFAQIDPPGYRFYGHKTGCWVVLPPKLPMDTTFGKKFYDSAESRREFYFVRSGTGLEQVIDTYVTNVRGRKIKDKRLFLLSPDTYGRELQEIFKSINEMYNTRLTLKRIEIYLHNYLAKTDGSDLTTAMLLTSRDDFLGMSPLHYTATPVKHLQRMYLTCCRKLLHDIEHELVAQGHPPISQIAHDDSQNSEAWHGMAGTSYRPKKKTVKRMVLRLQGRILDIQNMPKDKYKLLCLHNNIMRYTAILFAFSTGFRAVRSPMLPPSQIDDTTGFAVISDKDGIDYYNARIVWLPPICIQQYRIYLEHLECLLPKLEHLDLNAFNSLRYLLADPRPNDKIPLFFFFRIDGGVTSLRPIDIWKEIRQKLQYNLPANASRHYLRSNLLERGCSPEIVGAFMGHWERGEEPWGRYSALSPQHYAETIASHLIPMLEEDGWKLMSGMQKYWS